jgi:hypothetical protein
MVKELIQSRPKSIFHYPLQFKCFLNFIDTMKIDTSFFISILGTTEKHICCTSGFVKITLAVIAFYNEVSTRMLLRSDAALLHF